MDDHVYRRALLSLVISLSVTWVIALGCLEGLARRDAVFLRTSKVAGRRRIRTALRLTRVETTLAVAMYVGAGLLASLAPPAVAAHRHHLPPGHGVPLRPDRVRVEPVGTGNPDPAVPAPLREAAPARGAPSAARRVPRPALGATLAALCAGGVTSAFLAPCRCSRRR